MGSTAEKQIICTSCGFAFELSYPKGTRPPRFTACPSCRVRIDVRRASAESARDALKTGPTAAAYEILSGFRRGMLEDDKAPRLYFEGGTKRPETPSYFPTNRSPLGLGREEDANGPDDNPPAAMNPNMTQGQWAAFSDDAPSLNRPVRRKPLVRNLEEEQRASVLEQAPSAPPVSHSPKPSRARRPGDVTPPVGEMENRRAPIGFRPPSHGQTETFPKPRPVARPQTNTRGVARRTTGVSSSLNRPTPVPGRRIDGWSAARPAELMVPEAQPFRRIESRPNAATAAKIAATPPRRTAESRQRIDRTLPDIELDESRRAKATLLQALKEGTTEYAKSIEDELAAIRNKVSRRRSPTHPDAPQSSDNLFDDEPEDPSEGYDGQARDEFLSDDLFGAGDIPEFPDDGATQPDLPPDAASHLAPKASPPLGTKPAGVNPEAPPKRPTTRQRLEPAALEPRDTKPFLEVVKRQRQDSGISAPRLNVPGAASNPILALDFDEATGADTLPDGVEGAKRDPEPSSVTRSSITSLDSAQKAFIFGDSDVPPGGEEPTAEPEPASTKARPSFEHLELPSSRKWAEPAFLDHDEDVRDLLDDTPSRLGYRVAGVALLVLLLAMGFVVWSKSNNNAEDAPAAEKSTPFEVNHSKEETETLRLRAFDQARHQVDRARTLTVARLAVLDATDFRGPAVAARYKEAVRAFVAGEKDAAKLAMADAYSLGLEEVEQYILYGTLLIETAEYDKARKVLREARDRFPRQADLAPLLSRAFGEDPWFLPDTVTIGSRGLSGIKSLGGGSTITLRFMNGDTTVAAFKPAQSRLQSDYRAEIAAWRLCVLLECTFKIPYNRPVRITRSVFFELYNNLDSSKQRAYASNFDDLRWRGHEPSEFLYGTEKEWVDDFTQLPIEATAVWSPWLTQGQGQEDLEQPLAKSVAAWKDNPLTSTHHGRVLSRAEAMSTRDLAQQLSDMLVFDFLVGNWDRFSTVPEWWGANCQFGAGKLISIDNGAAFPVYQNSKVTERFTRVQRFSRSLIHELRLLDKDQTKAWLFPQPSSKEDEAFERFWKQRAMVLGRVDELVEQYGEDAVMAFD
ncbi:MAG: hypothetical protein AUK47_15915 [Deltaproteobacteria bacterium CG2_30_63_29]|nr:MAG: hypothetical protein AUK47_15915 [Deltaproteobacteria bacterium CG2_30_63_29]PJB43668.1 MAG: hypothetical protein CO108_09745 [Deltaproteobacteria bacterium CG_4_9_14_3_um_filter_63_12]